MVSQLAFALVLALLAGVNAFVATFVQLKNNSTGAITEEQERALVHDWFTEAFPSFPSYNLVHSPRLYKAYDGAQPNWVVVSGFTPNCISHANLSIDSEAYTLVSSLSSPNLPSTNIKWLNPVQTTLKPIPGAGSEFERWYREEHTSLLSKIKGWVRGRNFHLASEIGERRRYLGVQELSDETTIEEVVASPEFEAAMTTPWREEIMKSWEETISRIFEIEVV
ncbi:alpha beta hydrolase [Moniliophthora roreri MCA 2997]|uniref:Alpha beta hydrolase n=2 Tax=Moniliophthora roreri TaxID=221103 RepID=V2WYM2_MONRO|nr:alpha beta hydrolase [Moniliophthora roreri MCA 2997]KAI3600683.1 alpha beta hydrolase [Moniliophthora roreri]